MEMDTPRIGSATRSRSSLGTTGLDDGSPDIRGEKERGHSKGSRFFAERRVKTHFVDLQERPASPGELRRFAQRFGVSALIDAGARRYGELGLNAARLSDDRWLEKLALEPLLLRMPLRSLGTTADAG